MKSRAGRAGRFMACAFLVYAFGALALRHPVLSFVGVIAAFAFGFVWLLAEDREECSRDANHS